MPEASLPIINLINQQQLLRIVAPVFALVLLSFLVLAVLGTLRLRGLQRGRSCSGWSGRASPVPCWRRLNAAPALVRT